MKYFRADYWGDVIRRFKYERRRQRFSPYEIERQFGDTTVRMWINDPVAQKWYDIPEMGNDAELDFTHERMIAPGDVVFDCGSHQGMTTILFSRWVGDNGKVVAFEALPENFEVLSKNIEMNGVDNVEAVHAALGAEPGMATIDVRSNSNVSSGEFGRQVPMKCLDQYESYAPNLLKIDVEGFETEVLKGAQRVLARRPKIILELHTKALPKFGTSVAEVLELLQLDNYKVWIQADSDKPPVEYHGEDITTRVHLFLLPTG